MCVPWWLVAAGYGQQRRWLSGGWHLASLSRIRHQTGPAMPSAVPAACWLLLAPDSMAIQPQTCCFSHMGCRCPAQSLGTPPCRFHQQGANTRRLSGEVLPTSRRCCPQNLPGSCLSSLLPVSFSGPRDFLQRSASQPANPQSLPQPAHKHPTSALQGLLSSRLDQTLLLGRP